MTKRKPKPKRRKLELRETAYSRGRQSRMGDPNPYLTRDAREWDRGHREVIYKFAAKLGMGLPAE
jgi:hypothetical protein